MKHPARYFRAGVGAVITDGRGRVLVFERSDIPGAWQFPQGGMEKEDAEPVDGAFREIKEETGIRRKALRLLDQYPELLAYELPPKARTLKTGMGQVHYWFLFKLKKPSAAVDLPPDAEFRAFDWVPFNKAVARAVSFRKPLYRKLRARFESKARRS
jgi:putative (di)nucleoside polyphosphate hydrolase